MKRFASRLSLFFLAAPLVEANAAALALESAKKVRSPLPNRPFGPLRFYNSPAIVTAELVA